ncbi:hypothetical protein KKH27_06005, partial [bacterium]|nr:hypothetical protein [bacterium]MBU1984708.1 hypothetical protein [bacterium]
RAFYKVPEEWQRDRRATTAPRALLRALNILVLAGLAVWGALLLAKRTRRGEVAWKRAFLLAIVPAIVIACGSASDLYLAQESYFYNIEQPWSVFRMDSIVQALISTVMFYVLFAMGIALITALYRDSWDDFRAASRKKAGWDALLTAGAVIGAVLMVQTARAVLNAAAPAWASFSGWNVPEWIAIPWPILGMAPDLLSSILLWAVSATLFAYLWCGPVKTFALRGLLVIAGVILLLPGRAVEPGEWLLAAGHGLLAVLLIYVVLRVIVGGRPVLFVAAIIATGLFTVAARGIAIGNATTALHIWLLIAFVAIGFSLWLLIPGRIRRT